MGMDGLDTLWLWLQYDTLFTFMLLIHLVNRRSISLSLRSVCVVLYPYSLSLLFTCIALFPTLAEYQPVYSPLLFYLLLDYDCVQIVSLSRSRSTFRRATSRWCVSPVNLPVGYGAFATLS